MTKIFFLFTAFAFTYITTHAQKRLLFVMSAAKELPLKNGKTYKTGVFLSEFYPAYKALVKLGY